MCKGLILASLLLALTPGCDFPQPIQKSATNNPKIVVELMVEHDGCRVYRFNDGNHYIYFVKGGEQTMWGETHSNGKTSYTTYDSVPTISPTRSK